MPESDPARQEYDALLDAALAGTLTIEDQRRLAGYLRQPAARQRLVQMAALDAALRLEMQRREQSAASSAVKLSRSPGRTGRSAPSRWRNKGQSFVLPGLVLATVLLVLSAYWWWAADSGGPTIPNDGTSVSAPLADQVTLHSGALLVDGQLLQSGQVLASGSELVTEPAQEAGLQLPDGSQVQLAAATRLQIQELQVGHDRRFALSQGCVLCMVQKDALQTPFHVLLGRHTIAVIGTRFDVTAGPDGGRVDVYEGKVRLHLADAQTVAVKAGHYIELPMQGSARLGRHADDDVTLSLQSGLIARWSLFGDQPGVDSSGNALHLQLQTASAGQSSFWRLAHHPQLAPQHYSIALWYRKRAPYWQRQHDLHLINKVDWNSGKGFAINAHGKHHPDGGRPQQLYFTTHLANRPKGDWPGCAVGGIPLNTWRHYVMCFDGQQLQVFIDGQVHVVKDLGRFPALHKTGPLRIMAGPDDVRLVSLYDRALSAAEIRYLSKEDPEHVPE